MLNLQLDRSGRSSEVGYLVRNVLRARKAAKFHQLCEALGGELWPYLTVHVVRCTSKINVSKENFGRLRAGTLS